MKTRFRRPATPQAAAAGGGSGGERGASLAPPRRSPPAKIRSAFPFRGGFFMKVFETANIRNVAVVGHGGCGKTTLVSAILFDTGAVNRLGRVEDGSTVTDFDPDEIDRKISLQTAMAWGEWRKVKINFLDAPGYANFLSEARSALRVADGALVVVDSVAGVEVQTQKMWAYAEEYALPRLIVVNRMDRDRASFTRALDSLQSAFGRGVVPMAIPLGEEKGFVGVAGLVTAKAVVYADDQGGKYETVDLPPDVVDEANSWREKLIEMVAESNEELMEEFFEKGTLPQEDIVRGLRQGVLAGKIDRKSTRLNSSHSQISYAVFCLKKKKKREERD